MDKKNLFKIRQNKGIEFETLQEYNSTLKDLFLNAAKVPFVVGYLDGNPRFWDLRTLPPKTQSDKLTILSFLEGVNRLEGDYKQYGPAELNFRRAHLELGIDRRTRDEVGYSILSTGFQIQGVGYFLNLSWVIDRDINREERGVYSAKTTVYLPSTYLNTMRKFVGPNFSEGD